jgi:hypothetical protein
MILFKRKAKIKSFVATGIRYDGSDVDSNIATDDLITTLESKLDDSRERFRNDPSYGTQLAKKYATLSLLCKRMGYDDKMDEYRRSAREITHSDSFPDSGEALEVRKLVDSL